MNALLGFERAIVTDVAGTTRDVVTESVSVGGIKLNLSDTAGVHNTEDEVEKIGVLRSKQELENSSLVFGVFDVSKEISNDEQKIIQLLQTARNDKNVIIILNKCDLCNPEDMLKYFRDAGFENTVTVSALTKDGMNGVEEAVKKLYPDVEKVMSGEIIANARQQTALVMALSNIEKALYAVKTLTPDTACLDMEAALGELLEADGRQVSEEIVDSIFSHFCVGK